MKHIVFFSFLCSLLYSCENHLERHLVNNKQSYIKTFPEIVRLDGKKMNLDLIGFQSFAVIDTFFIAFDFMGRDRFMKVYSTKTHKHLGNIIDKGKGPNELITFLTQEQYYIDLEGCHLWIADCSFFTKCYSLNLTRSLAQKETVMDTCIVMKKNPASFNYILNDSMASGIQYKDEMIYSIDYSLKDREVISKDSLFQSRFENKEHYKALSFMVSNLKPYSNDKIVGACTSIKRINILDLEQKSTLEIDIEESYWNYKEIINRKEQIRTYGDVKVTNEFIYALLVNKTEAELYGNKKTKGCEIHILSWDAKPIAKIKLKENLYLFSIDPNNKFLYGCTANEELFQYDLTTILK